MAFLPQGVAASVDARGTATLETLLGEVVPELTGRITFDGGFRLDEDGSWTGRSRLASDGMLRFRRTEVAKLEALLLADPEGIRIVEGRADSPTGTTVEHLEVSVRNGTIEAGADGNLVSTDIFPSLGLPRDLVMGAGRYKARLWRAAAGEPLRWSVDATPVPAAGAANALDGRFTGEGGGGRIALAFDGAWGRSGLTFRLRGDDAVQLDGLTIEAGLDAPDATSARAAFGHLLAQGREIGLELPLETTPVPDGPMAVDATVRLVAGKLTGLEATVDLDGVHLGRARFERYHGRFEEIARGHWKLAMDAADAAAGRVEAELEIPPGNSLGIRARASEADYDAVTEIVRAIGIELELPEGRGLVTGTIDGEWSPTAADLAFDAATELTIGNATPAAVAARGRLTNEAVRIDDGRLRLPGLEATFAGDVGLPSSRGPLAAALRSHVTVDLGPLFAWLDFGEATGTVEGDVGGTFESLEKPLPLDGSVSWKGLSVAGVRIPEGTAALTRRDDGFELASTAGRLDHRLVIEGPIGNPYFALDTRSDGLPLQDLAAEAPDTASAVQAEGRGTLRVEGLLRERPTWHGSLALEGLALAGATIEAQLEQPARIELERGGRLVVVSPVRLVTARDSRLTIEGDYGLWGSGEGQLGLVITGTVDLAILEIYSSDIVSSGSVTATLKVGGTSDHPELFGAMKVSGGRVLYVPFGQTVDGIEGEIDYDGTEATIRSLTGQSGGGRIEVEGRIAIADLAPERLDLRTTVRNVAVAYPRGFVGRYDADATATGTLEGIQVRGTVDVLSGRYAQEFQLAGGVLGRSRTVQPKASAAGWMQRIGLALEVSAAETLSVRNELARVDASARIGVRGTLAAPLLVGNVTLIEGGTITFRDVDYDLLSGQVTLDDARAQPIRVRAVAETEVSGYQVRIDLDATTASVEYTLTSTPALSRADILSLLLTGRTNRESGGASSASLESQGAAYFGTALSEMLLSGSAKKYLGLTRFSISPVEASPGSEPTARLTVGKRLDEKTNVVYSRDLSGDTSDVYSIEREIAPKTKIIGGQNDKGGVGAIVRWTYRFGAGADDRRSLEAPDRLGEVEAVGLPEGMRVTRRTVGVSRGAPVTRSTLIQAAEGLKLALVERGYLQASVVPHRVQVEGSARATIRLDVTPGPKWEVRITGAGGTEKIVRRALDEFWALVEFRPGLHRQTASLVRERLAEDGYAAATVEISDGGPDPPWVEVVVDPGARVRVAEVKVAGNSALPSSEVLKQILSRPGWRPGDKPVYRPREIAEDAEAIRTLYATEGYLDAQVVPRVRFRTGGDEVLVTYRIDEGARAKIGTVRVDGDWPQALGRASDRIPFRSGETFKAAKVEETERVLRTALDDAGYYDSSVSMLLQSGDGRVDVTYRVQAGRVVPDRLGRLLRAREDAREDRQGGGDSQGGRAADPRRRPGDGAQPVRAGAVPRDQRRHDSARRAARVAGGRDRVQGDAGHFGLPVGRLGHRDQVRSRRRTLSRQPLGDRPDGRPPGLLFVDPQGRARDARRPPHPAQHPGGADHRRLGAGGLPELHLGYDERGGSARGPGTAAQALARALPARRHPDRRELGLEGRSPGGPARAADRAGPARLALVLGTVRPARRSLPADARLGGAQRRRAVLDLARLAGRVLAPPGPDRRVLADRQAPDPRLGSAGRIRPSLRRHGLRPAAEALLHRRIRQRSRIPARRAQPAGHGSRRHRLRRNPRPAGGPAQAGNPAGGRGAVALRLQPRSALPRLARGRGRGLHGPRERLADGPAVGPARNPEHGRPRLPLPHPDRRAARRVRLETGSPAGRIGRPVLLRDRRRLLTRRDGWGRCSGSTSGQRRWDSRSATTRSASRCR